MYYFIKSYIVEAVLLRELPKRLAQSIKAKKNGNKSIEKDTEAFRYFLNKIQRIFHLLHGESVTQIQDVYYLVYGNPSRWSKDIKARLFDDKEDYAEYCTAIKRKYIVNILRQYLSEALSFVLSQTIDAKKLGNSWIERFFSPINLTGSTYEHIRFVLPRSAEGKLLLTQQLKYSLNTDLARVHKTLGLPEPASDRLDLGFVIGSLMNRGITRSFATVLVIMLAQQKPFGIFNHFMGQAMLALQNKMGDGHLFVTRYMESLTDEDVQNGQRGKRRETPPPSLQVYPDCVKFVRVTDFSKITGAGVEGPDSSIKREVNELTRQCDVRPSATVELSLIIRKLPSAGAQDNDMSYVIACETLLYLWGESLSQGNNVKRAEALTPPTNMFIEVTTCAPRGEPCAPGVLFSPTRLSSGDFTEQTDRWPQAPATTMAVKKKGRSCDSGTLRNNMPPGHGVKRGITYSALLQPFDGRVELRDPDLSKQPSNNTPKIL